MASYYYRYFIPRSRFNGCHGSKLKINTAPYFRNDPSRQGTPQENLSVTAAVNNQLLGVYTYDSAGNTTHDATANLNQTYDHFYDANGNLLQKVMPLPNQFPQSGTTH